MISCVEKGGVLGWTLSIKTENKLMAFSDSSWQDFSNTVISTGSYIIFYQGGPIDHSPHVPVPVFQPSA